MARRSAAAAHGRAYCRVAIGSERFEIPLSFVPAVRKFVSDGQGDSIPWRQGTKEYMDANGGEAATVLRGLRARDDLSQDDVAKKIGTTRFVIALLESGRRPISLKMAKRLAEAFDVDYRVFL